MKTYQQNTEPEIYYHSRLILYLPWHNEDELIGSYASYKEHYLDISDIVEHSAHAFFLHSKEIYAALNNIVENGPPETV